MNLTDNIKKLIQYRIEQEEFSGRLYKSMATWLNFNGYLGASSLWEKYSKEESIHAEWAYNYLLSLDIKPLVDMIDLPRNEYKSLKEIIELSYQHETEITKQCNELAKEAFKVFDFMTLELAQRYLKEQREEYSKIQYWKDRIKAFGDSKESLRLLDNEMGER